LWLTKTCVRISDNTLFTTQCEILLPAIIQKKIQKHTARSHISVRQLHGKIV
jgi:glutamate dehydrogenase/leucine dehydrogenase